MPHRGGGGNRAGGHAPTCAAQRPTDGSASASPLPHCGPPAQRAARVDDEARFLNADEAGPHSPGPTPDAIEYLMDKKIVGWGTQCIGTDAGQAGGMEPPYPAHNLLHKNNCFGLASLANLDKLPPKGAILIAAPLKIKNGTGSPIRALALVPKG